MVEEVIAWLYACVVGGRTIPRHSVYLVVDFLLWSVIVKRNS